MTGRRAIPPSKKRVSGRGMVLILVLVVIAVLSLGAFTFSELMLVEREAADLTGRQAQSRALAESGVEMARLFLASDELSQNDAGGWYNNPDRFQSVLVIDDVQARHRGRFTFVAPQVEEGYYSGIRYGVEDESTRLNLNALLLLEKHAEAAGVANGGRELLLGLPGMTEDIADAILDWIDTDDEIREFGAEIEYYSSLDPPYAPKNGPLETVEELLLVRDVSPWLLFGADANHNGQIDPSEPDLADTAGILVEDNSDGSMDRGWAAYLTLYSLETNLRPDGEPKIDLNQDDMETLHGELEDVFGGLPQSAQWATFIVAYRQFGPLESQPPDAKVEAEYGVDLLDLSKKGEHQVTTVLDLVGKNVEVKGEGENAESTVLETPFSDVPGVMSTYLSTLMDTLTANPAELLPARININQAPRTVLANIPEMTSEIAEEIISRRVPDRAAADSDHRHETWILAEGIVTLDQMKSLMPFVTAGGKVFRAQVVGYFDEGGPASRIEVVLDASKSPAQLILWRDLSHLGAGYPLETLGVGAPDW
ncbi:MAG: hypothetical protein ABIK89_25925 [Planctomycetota bacterium]